MLIIRNGKSVKWPFIPLLRLYLCLIQQDILINCRKPSGSVDWFLFGNMMSCALQNVICVFVFAYFAFTHVEFTCIGWPITPIEFGMWSKSIIQHVIPVIISCSILILRISFLRHWQSVNLANATLGRKAIILWRIFKVFFVFLNLLMNHPIILGHTLSTFD